MWLHERKRASLELAGAFTEPFPYFTAAEGLGEVISSTFLVWLENEAPWKLVETDFYEQYEVSLIDVSLPPPSGT